MWIKTKEQNALYCVAGVRIKRLVSESCYAIEGMLHDDTVVTLGEYPTYEEVQAKLHAIEAFLEAGDRKVFRL